jgi:hypothetical protein
MRRGTLQEVARRDGLAHGMRFCCACFVWPQTMAAVIFCKIVFLCDSTAGRFLLMQNHDHVLYHKYQAVIVAPIDGGTNYCMMDV